MEKNKQWSIIYTRPGCEKKLTALLVKKRIEAYCPLNRIQRQWMDRKRIITEPLFSSYVFVKVPLTDHDHANIKQTEGFVNFVYWLNKPAIIWDEEINTIKKFLIEYDHVSIEKSEVLPNDIVRILNGPLVLWEGKVVEVRTNTIKILLPSLGYSLVAEIRKDNTIINKSQSPFDIKKVI